MGQKGRDRTERWKEKQVQRAAVTGFLAEMYLHSLTDAGQTGTLTLSLKERKKK